MKDNFYFSSKAWDHNSAKLTNKIFKLLPMYENNEDWEKQLNTILLELKGYNRVFADEAAFMTLIVKLNSLFCCENKFSFRKLVFESISVLKEVTIQ